MLRYKAPRNDNANVFAQYPSAVMDIDTILETFPLENLKKTYHIQNYDVTGLEAILHITEHFSYHVGQIVYITKFRTGKDLKFYNL